MAPRTVQVKTYLTEEMTERLDKLTEKLNQSRSEFLKNSVITSIYRFEKTFESIETELSDNGD